MDQMASVRRNVRCVDTDRFRQELQAPHAGCWIGSRAYFANETKHVSSDRRVLG